jgi:hypothetical protein
MQPSRLFFFLRPKSFFGLIFLFAQRGKKKVLPRMGKGHPGYGSHKAIKQRIISRTDKRERNKPVHIYWTFLVKLKNKPEKKLLQQNTVAWIELRF